MSSQRIDWDALECSYPKKLVKELRKYLDQTGPLELSAEDLTAEVPEADELMATTLLRAVASLGVLIQERRFICPECDEKLTAEDAEARICKTLERPFSGKDLQEIFVFTRSSISSRDVRWVLALHGMNTRGAWQEDFNWLISTTYSHMVPVAIYKYGIVRPGAFFRFRHQSLSLDLAARIKRLVGQTEKSGFGRRPDVIAHSLGTLVLGHALRGDSSLRVGRVILTGSILRPDFNWSELTNRGQVQAVLNNYGTKDFWALVAHYFIPDSGPSGREGFNDQKGVINVAARGFKHSDFFQPRHMSQQFETLWRPFLTLPLEELPSIVDRSEKARHWEQASWFLRATLLRLLLITCVGAIALLFLSSLVVGFFQIAARLVWPPS